MHRSNFLKRFSSLFSATKEFLPTSIFSLWQYFFIEHLRYFQLIGKIFQANKNLFRFFHLEYKRNEESFYFLYIAASETIQECIEIEVNHFFQSNSHFSVEPPGKSWVTKFLIDIFFKTWNRNGIGFWLPLFYIFDLCPFHSFTFYSSIARALSLSPSSLCHHWHHRK